MPELPPLREVIARFRIGARRSLGQNFLLDMNLTRRIARAAGDLSRGSVIEVGPGPGGLTRALLLEGAVAVIAAEKDVRCQAALSELQASFQDRLTLVAADALQVDITSLAAAPRVIVSNLPYNISTALLLRWLRIIFEDPEAIDRMILMFQKEVADRLVAEPGTKAYGRLSVVTQWLCEVRCLFQVKPEAFTPPPKVMSTVTSITPRRTPRCTVDFAAMERVTAAAFGQRRKMLRQSLKSLVADPAALLAEAGIEGSARAEELDVPAFCRLAKVLEEA